MSFENWNKFVTEVLSEKQNKASGEQNGASEKEKPTKEHKDNKKALAEVKGQQVPFHSHNGICVMVSVLLIALQVHIITMWCTQQDNMQL